LLAVLAILAISLSLWQLTADKAGLQIEEISIGDTPATVFRPEGGQQVGPVVVIAHGFAGSQQLMQPFAITLARNGYVAVTFDFLGHGRHPDPLGGDVGDPDGSSLLLLRQLDQVVTHAMAQGAGGKIALLGHSMASDIVVRYAKDHEARVAATVAVSMYSPAADATGPHNLLVITGALESDGLKREALRAVGAGGAGRTDPPQWEQTYGQFNDGSARRAVLADGVEHVGVLFARESMEEAARWLDRAFDRGDGTVVTLRWGPWVILLLLGVLVLAKPLSSRLPALGGEPLGANLTWRQFLPAALVPAVATPLLLWVAPHDFLAVIAGDYLAAHFLAYGLISAAVLYWLRRRRVEPQPVRPIPSLKLIGVAGLIGAYMLVGFGLSIDQFITNFWPDAGRAPLLVALIAGALVYFTADEWLARGGDAPRGGYWLAKLFFLGSLAAAVALDPDGLFFLLILVPVIVPVFLVVGLVSRWCYLRTRHPIPAGIAGALLMGWAIGVTFPILTG